MAGLASLDIVFSGHVIGHAHVVPGSPFEVGRQGASCRIEDPAMSSRHFALWQDGDDVLLRDLGSTNGTLLNGKAVSGAVALASGDHITAGDTVFIVSLGGKLPIRIVGTNWRILKIPSGFVPVPHFGLQSTSKHWFRENVVCKEEEESPRMLLSSYVDQQLLALKQITTDVVTSYIDAPPGYSPEQCVVTKVAFKYTGEAVNQFHLYLQKGGRIGIAAWTHMRPHGTSNESLHEILECLSYG